MKKSVGQRVLIYFLAISFLVMMNGVPVVAASGRSIPIGEMLSRGEVKFEARENVWKPVELSQFPVFTGTKIKTEKGEAVITLSDDTQIKVGAHTAFFFDAGNHLVLSQGKIEFRLPYASQTGFRIGDLAVLKTLPFQASKDLSSAPSRSEETVGSITLHSNGAVTISTARGKLSVLNQDRELLAGLSSNDSITMPSTTVGERAPVRVAQIGGGLGAGGSVLGGLSGAALGALGGLGLVFGGAIYGASEANDTTDLRPLCP